MQLQFKENFDTLPSTTEGLLRMLRQTLAAPALRPGDSAAEAYYQTGACDLVDYLYSAMEMEQTAEPEEDQSWYSDDETMKDYVEGEW